MIDYWKWVSNRIYLKNHVQIIILSNYFFQFDYISMSNFLQCLNNHKISNQFKPH